MMTTSTPQGPRAASRSLLRRPWTMVLVLVVLAVAAGMAYGLEVRPWQGAVPDDAFVAGEDAAGAPLYVCVATSWGGQHPGALGADGVCHVAWGGQAYTFDTDFAVVTGSRGEWVEGGDSIPAGAFAAGDDGGPLYVCRVDGRPGKLSDDVWCYVATGGEEKSFTSGYQVLVD